MAEDIAQWLDRLGAGKYAEAFVENGVDLRALPHLSEDDLKELGVLLGCRPGAWPQRSRSAGTAGFGLDPRRTAGYGVAEAHGEVSHADGVATCPD